MRLAVVPEPLYKARGKVELLHAGLHEYLFSSAADNAP